jgi:hypothetical protein
MTDLTAITKIKRNQAPPAKRGADRARLARRSDHVRAGGAIASPISDLALVSQFASAGIPPRHALRLVGVIRRSAAELQALLAVTSDQAERDRLILEARSTRRARISAVLRSLPKRVRK